MSLWSRDDQMKWPPFLMKSLCCIIHSIPDSCLSESTWQGSSETATNAKICLTESGPHNNTKTEGGIVFRSFECHIFKGKETINLSHIISRWPSSSALTDVCLLWRLASSQRRVCDELGNAVFQGCRQKIGIIQDVAQKDPSVDFCLRFCSCLCLQRYILAYFHLRPHKQQMLLS